MHRTLRFLLLGLLAAGAAATAAADLNSLIIDLNLQAKDDLEGFTAKLTSQFAVPPQEVRVLLDTVAAPADAFLCLQLGALAHKPVKEIIPAYKEHKGKGWGAVAQALGIDPGSSAFRAFKNGRLTLTGGKAGKGKGKAKGAEPDKEKGKDQ
jgi:hypothetical protein